MKIFLLMPLFLFCLSLDSVQSIDRPRTPSPPPPPLAGPFVPMDLENGDIVIRRGFYYARYFERCLEEPETYLLLNGHTGELQGDRHFKPIQITEASFIPGDYLFRDCIKIGIYERHHGHHGFRLLPEDQQEHEEIYVTRMLGHH